MIHCFSTVLMGQVWFSQHCSIWKMLRMLIRSFHSSSICNFLRPRDVDMNHSIAQDWPISGNELCDVIFFDSRCFIQIL
jgi:hypothetical protein